MQELRLRGGLAAGEHKAVEGTGEVGGLAQLDGDATKGLQALLVLDEGPLQGEDGDRWGHGILLIPAWAMRMLRDETVVIRRARRWLSAKRRARMRRRWCYCPRSSMMI